jgi:phosphoribosylformimino-5-aminoimidazole carboxamide ribotide isomerase
MRVYPAIDIKGGRVVRWLEGESFHETVYGDDPLAQALIFAQQGANWIHVVDMDRAFATGADNLDCVRRIAGVEHVKVQIGGSIDTLEMVRDAMHTGAARIVLGTAAALSPDLFARLISEVGASGCALAIDTRGGEVALRGKSDRIEQSVSDLVRLAVYSGVTTIVYRDLMRDGMTVGADVEAAKAIRSLGADVILAGGVASLEDVRNASRAGLAGVIIGRALYEGRFSLQDAIACSL